MEMQPPTGEHGWHGWEPVRLLSGNDAALPDIRVVARVGRKLFYCYACKSAQGQVPTCKKPQQIHITTGNLIWGRGRVAPVCGSTSNKFYKEY